MDPTSAAPPPDEAPHRRRRIESAFEMRQRRRRWFRYGVFTTSLVLVVHALFGESGYLATVRAEREYARVAAERDAVRQENEAIQRDIDRLDNDPAALEEAARGTLQMIKPGEALVIVNDRPAGGDGGR